MSAPYGCLVALIVVLRIAAGAAILAWCDAPRWALVAWLLFHIQVRVLSRDLLQKGKQ